MRIVVKLTPSVRKLKTTLPPEAQAEFERCLDELGRTRQLMGEVDLPVPQHAGLLRPVAGFLVIHRQEKHGFLRETLWVTVKHLVPARDMNAFLLQHWTASWCGAGGATSMPLVPEGAIAILDNTSRLDLARKLAMVVLTIAALVLTSLTSSRTRIKWDFLRPNQNEPPQRRVNGSGFIAVCDRET